LEPPANPGRFSERLADLADARGLRLAVNHNGRWAPHFAWMREAAQSGLLGEVETVHCAVHFDHNWTATTPFNDIDDRILYDFGIHWFDFLASIFGQRLTRAHATRARTRSQSATPPLFAQTLIEVEGGQASLVFGGGLRYGANDTTYVGGSAGSIISSGSTLNDQTLRLITADGEVEPPLEGSWFASGFLGTMGELLCAIDEGREPTNGARGNLKSLALCFAAMRATRTGAAVEIGSVRSLAEAVA
jgi:predicted dehydrogenase